MFRCYILLVSDHPKTQKESSMKSILHSTIATFLTVFLSLQADAASDIQIGVPSYGGTGCPAGAASISVSSTHDGVYILFDQIAVEAGATTGRRIERKSCNLSIPLQVPAGYSAAIERISPLQGFAELPKGAIARVELEAFWSGARGPALQKILTGPMSANWVESENVIPARPIVWSGCGASVGLRLNSILTVQTNQRLEQAITTIDSDFPSNAQPLIRLKLKRCN